MGIEEKASLAETPQPAAIGDGNSKEGKAREGSVVAESEVTRLDRENGLRISMLSPSRMNQEVRSHGFGKN